MSKSEKCNVIMYSPNCQTIRWGDGPPNENVGKEDNDNSVYIDRINCHWWVKYRDEYIDTGPLCINDKSEYPSFIIKEGLPNANDGIMGSIYLDSQSGIFYEKSSNNEWINIASICDVINDCNAIIDLNRELNQTKEEIQAARTDIITILNEISSIYRDLKILEEEIGIISDKLDDIVDNPYFTNDYITCNDKQTLLITPNKEDNINISLQPKGTGGFQLNSDGECRGDYTVDMQMSRTEKDQVASGMYSNIGGGYGNKASAPYSTIPGGEGLIANVDHMTTIGKYNKTSNEERPDDNEGTEESTKVLTINNGWNNITNVYKDHTLFSIGYGDSTERKDVFLVNRKGTTWTRNAYTCSFGGDYAEEWVVNDINEDISIGDVVIALDNGKVTRYKGNENSHSIKSIVGIVTPHPSIIASLKYYDQSLDEDTLLPLKENRYTLAKKKYEKTIIVGMMGRVPIKKEYLKYDLPESWFIMNNPSIFEGRFKDYAMALVR